MTAQAAQRPGPTGSTRVFVAWVALAVVVARLAYLALPLHPDEAGYLLVARSWSLGGPELYGHYWVDRAPGLIGLYKLAALLPWDWGIRLVALPFAALFVASAAWAAQLASGPLAARWAAVVGAALVTTPLLGADSADGELFAAALVMLAVALSIRAASRPSFWSGVLVGLAGAVAVLLKQGFVDAFAFLAVLLVASRLASEHSERGLPKVFAGAVAGAGTVFAAAAGYALSAGVGLEVLWYDLFAFRGAALRVIEGQSLAAPITRAEQLVGLAFVSGVALLLLVLAVRAWGGRRARSPLALAIGATLALELVGIAGGGSYWPHYLLQLAPMLALAAGVWAPLDWRLRWAARLTVVSSVVVVTFFAGQALVARPGTPATALGGWVAAASQPRDTATVLYGNAQVQLATGLPSPYPYLWSLPMRTLDPELRQLRRLVNGPAAPTWLVAWSDLDSWDLDPSTRTREELVTHYHLVAVICGHEVWLRNGSSRPEPPMPDC